MTSNYKVIQKHTNISQLLLIYKRKLASKSFIDHCTMGWVKAAKLYMFIFTTSSVTVRPSHAARVKYDITLYVPVGQNWRWFNVEGPKHVVHLILCTCNTGTKCCIKLKVSYSVNVLKIAKFSIEEARKNKMWRNS